MRKTICLLLAGGLIFGLAACGGGNYSDDTVVIYREYNGVVGDDAQKVKAALEQKFEEDTGEKINLVVEPTSTSMLGDKVTGALSAPSDRIDAIVAHNSSDSLVTQLIGDDDEVKDITRAVEENAPRYLQLTSQGADTTPYTKGLYDGRLYAMCSADKNSVFAMMINREHMANTSFDPEEYDIANEGYKSLTISQFTQLLYELRENNETVTRPLAAYPYDIEYFIAPVFDNAGYVHMQMVGDRIYPAYATESYLSVLEYERMLQLEKLWIENPINAISAERDFKAGKASIFISYPDVEQEIDIVRELKETTGDDCIMLAPLAKDDGTVNGNARHETAFLGMVVPQKGKNTGLLLRFLDWLYSDRENYDLAKYGIEGEHWIKTTAADGRAGYAYPESKRADYEKRPAYDGLYCFLPNINISDRVYTDYTERENAWISAVEKFKTYPAEGYADEGMNIPAVPRTERGILRLATQLGNEYVKLRAYGWSDAEIPEGKSLADLHATFMNNVNGAYSEYIDWLNNEYKKIIASYQ